MSTLLSDLRAESKFIDKLIENGYVFTSLSALLHSIGIHESHDEIEVLLTIRNEYLFMATLENIDINYAISVCDELHATRALNIIMKNIQKLHSVSTAQIINATIITNYNGLIATCDNGYRIIGSDTHANTYYKYISKNYDVQQINNACANGLYIHARYCYINTIRYV